MLNEQRKKKNYYLCDVVFFDGVECYVRQFIIDIEDFNESFSKINNRYFDCIVHINVLEKYNKNELAYKLATDNELLKRFVDMYA